MHSVKHVLLSALLLSSFANLSAADDKNLFRYNGKSFSKDDMPPAAKQAMFDADHMQAENYKKVIDGFILETYLKEQVKKLNKSVEAVVAEVLKVKDFTDKDAQAWYDKNKESLGGRDFASLKREIINYLRNEEQEKVKDKVIADLKKTGGFALTMAMPKAPAVEIAYQGYPKKGAANPKATIVEFADYLCGHCKHASEILKKVVEKHKDKVQFVYLYFPLSNTGPSRIMAQGAVCAEKQNKFWEYHSMAFENQMKITQDSPLQFAKNLKLNEAAFSKCLNSDEAKKAVDFARAEGDRVGVMATPSIYINGVKVPGYSEDMLNDELKKVL